MYDLKIFNTKKELFNFINKNKIKDFKYKLYLFEYKNTIKENYFLSFKLY